MNQPALFLTLGLTKATLQCTVKPLFFFFHTKSQPFNKKQPIGTINQIKQSERTIQKTNLQNKHDKPSHQSIVKSITKTTTTNNPKSLNQKHAQNKHNKQLRQNAMFLNIKISQKATTSKQTTNTLFIKTQYNHKKQSYILPLR